MRINWKSIGLVLGGMVGMFLLLIIPKISTPFVKLETTIRNKLGGK